jgi:hypothetical protein
MRLPAPGSTQAKFYSSKEGELELYILIQDWPDSSILFSKEQGQFWVQFQSTAGCTRGHTATARSAELAGPYRACGEEKPCPEIFCKKFLYCILL